MLDRSVLMGSYCSLLPFRETMCCCLLWNCLHNILSPRHPRLQHSYRIIKPTNLFMLKSSLCMRRDPMKKHQQLTFDVLSKSQNVIHPPAHQKINRFLLSLLLLSSLSLSLSLFSVIRKMYSDFPHSHLGLSGNVTKWNAATGNKIFKQKKWIMRVETKQIWLRSFRLQTLN